MAVANFYQSIAWTGLGTYTVALPVTGDYFIRGKIQIPRIVEGTTPSALVVTINQNGSPIYTGTAGADGFYVVFGATAADSMTIVFTSANAVDAALNAFKSTFEIGQGV